MHPVPRLSAPFPPLVRRSLLPVLAFLAMASAARAQDFTLLTGVPPVTESGGHRAAAWIDADGDGDLDLYFTRGGAPLENNNYYRNDGGSFVLMTSAVIGMDGLRCDGCSFGDWNGDGHVDLFVVSWHGELNALFQNQGDGTYVRILTGDAVNTGTYSEDCAWVDYDQDGDLDLYLINSNATNNVLYRNDGGGVLAVQAGNPLSNEGRTSRHGAWADYDDDGDIDVYVANESNQANDLWQNQKADLGTPAFVKQSLGDVTGALAPSFSASWGDYDNDGDLDLVVANWNNAFNRLYRNELVETGTATFALEATGPSEHRGFSVGTAWADVDNDADLDLLITNGFSTTPGQTRRNFLYRNDAGTLVRIEEGPIWDNVGWSYGASFGDYDGDGDLDLAVANWLDDDQTNYLFRNDSESNGNHWLQIDLVGTTSNTSGIGAVIRARATIDGGTVRQRRDVQGSNGYCSQNLRSHFGLGDAATVDSLVVTWPSGLVQVLVDVAADQRLTIVEGSSPVGAPEVPAGAGKLGALLGAWPNPFRSGTAVAFELAGRQRITLGIHDVAGRQVRLLESGEAAGGVHQVRWDGRGEGGADVAPGVYFARLRTSGGVSHEKLVRLR
jgi:hypothetical protein